MEPQNLELTGERFVPGGPNERLADDHVERYKFAASYSAGRHVLDIACGAGYGAPLLVEGGATSYQGVDIGPEAVAFAQQRYGREKISYAVGDIRTFGENEQYDLVTCFETIEHVAFYDEALANLYRVMKPGGVLVVSSPNRPVSTPENQLLTDPPSNRFHTQEFTPEELTQSLQSAGFSVDDAVLFGQRQRRHFKTKWLRKASRKLFGNPNHVKSAKVEPVTSKSPKYFVLVVRKD